VIDGFQFNDDWGVQTGLFINRQMWLDIFQPRYRTLFQAVHQVGAHVMFHSYGRTIEILPDLIETGVDIMTTQFSAHTLEELSEVCQGKVCVLTDLDRQHLLPFGTPQEIKDYVKRVIESLGTSQGGIIAYAEIADPDVPIENAQAVLEAFHEYGQY